MVAPSLVDIADLLCKPGGQFEIETVDIRGTPTRTWKGAPRTLLDLLIAGRNAGGSRDLFRLDHERLTHEQHYAQVRALAKAFVDVFGVAEGDRVAIAMRNYPEWSVAFFAATAIGAIAVPLNAFWNGAELAFGVADSGASVLVADGERLERLAPHLDELASVQLIVTRSHDRKGAWPLPDSIAFSELVAGTATMPTVPVAPEDPATIFYTSGTTGWPKGVLGTHRNICSNPVTIMYTKVSQSMRDAQPLDARSRPPVVLLSVPLFHATGCHAMLLSAVYFGSTLVFMRKWEPHTCLDLIERHGITSIGGAPAMVWDLVNDIRLAEYELRTLTDVGAGGAATAPELLRRLETVLPERRLTTGYGLTESSSTVASIGGNDFDLRPDSVGVPAPVYDLRFMDPAGHDVQQGTPGEILIQGPGVVPGYWNRPEATAETFTDGWLHTGDIGRVDDDGFLYIVDRAKDIIIRGGENISSSEVEAALLEHPDVLEAAAFAVPHTTLGEEVGVAIRLRDDSVVTDLDLRMHAQSVLAAFKVPSHIWFAAEPFPRSASGKVLKRDVRAHFVDDTKPEE